MSSQQRAPAQGNRGEAGAPARGTAAAAPATGNFDCPTFGGDNTRTNANMAATRITSANVRSMVRQKVLGSY